MRVMLVCMAGFTTHVLANRLQEYSKSQGSGDTFFACKAGNAGDFLNQIDCLLIAPQAASRCDDLCQEAEARGIPSLRLSEEDLAFARVEHICEMLETVRPCPGDEAGRIHLTGRVLLRILGGTLLICLPILLLALVSGLLWKGTGWEAAHCLWEISGGIFSLYLLFALGYQYGKQTGRGQLACALITLGATLLLMPMNGVETYGSGMVRIVDGTVPTSFFSLPFCIFLFFPGLLAVFLQEGFQRIEIHLPLNTTSASGGISLDNVICGGCIFTVFLFLRMVLAALF